MEAVTAVFRRTLNLEMVSPLLDAPVPLLLPACCAEGLGRKTNGYSMVDRPADGWVSPNLEAKNTGLNGLIEAYIGGEANLASGDGQYPIFPLALRTKSADQMVDVVGCGDSLGQPLPFGID